MYILLDGGTGSAADEYVNAAQRIGLATLAGQSTAGSCGPYFNPVMVRLPASGMVFVLEADLMLNQDGSVNEIVGTRPDMELAPCLLPEKVTKEELLHDEWVRKIIAEP
jgi:C-terminal processing protease CtpA/Prc